jgi:hypothetical protein
MWFEALGCWPGVFRLIRPEERRRTEASTAELRSLEFEKVTMVFEQPKAM